MKTIRRLKLGEGSLYKEVRLKSLKESPEAFATTFEDALTRDLDSWCAQADSSAEGNDRATFIIDSSEPLGLAAIYRDEESSTEGELIQMWVAPELRGEGAAHDILVKLFQWAGVSGLSVVRAEVYHANAKALRFYEKYGFRVSTAGDSESTTILRKTV